MKPTNRIQFLPLPTDAPWTNPTEKYWLKLAREWLRFHPYGGDKFAAIVVAIWSAFAHRRAYGYYSRYYRRGSYARRPRRSRIF
jgi:hypothetical protein